ncbi:MAG: 2,3-diphosphoglycerate-dependent phosphoglycerate mutase [Acidimicrobiia bacterium]
MNHKLVLVRHGQSTWNQENRFTGWTDVGLTDQGRREAVAAAEMLADAGISFDLAYTSVLKRAIHTLDITLADMDLSWIPVIKDWHLNERHYGALQGLNKAETAAEHGEDQVHIWRRSYSIRPPELALDDPRHPGNDVRYAAVDPSLLPASECLADVVDRMVPYWQEVIAPQVAGGVRLVIFAHGNSLRALVKHLDGIADADIPSLNIPTGIPLVYELNDELEPIDSYYLGDPAAAAAAAQEVADQGRQA